VVKVGERKGDESLDEAGNLKRVKSSVVVVQQQLHMSSSSMVQYDETD
jgi:hypothetical protein